MTGQELINHIYNKMPQVYRDADLTVNQQLKRYLDSLGAGFSALLNDINNFTALISPDDCPEAFLPLLYNSFGLDYVREIPAKYHRKILRNIGNLMQRRGTLSIVKYLMRATTSMECEVVYSRDFDINGVKTYNLHATAVVDNINKLNNMDVSLKAVGILIRQFVPENVNITLDMTVDGQYTNTEILTGIVVSESVTIN
jgi:phage tail-like protein